jgi:hypothetical protein
MIEGGERVTTEQVSKHDLPDDVEQEEHNNQSEKNPHHLLR